MILNEFSIYFASTFKNELSGIISYIKYKLKEPQVADKLYAEIIKEISYLEFMPQRHTKFNLLNQESRFLYKILIKKYVIIYEVRSNTRSNFYLTYISL